MNELNWRYSLVVTETQLDGEWNKESQKQHYPQTETTTYSNHLPDVFNALLEHDIQQFEKQFAPTQESGKYLENAILYDMEKDIVLLEVMNIDFDVALENKVPAGIYLRFPDVHESDVQELLGIDLSRVQHFGVDEGWLRIAESTYNRGVDIAVDPGWQQITEGIVLHAREHLHQDSWKYRLVTTHQPFAEQEPARIFQFPYTNFNQATEAMQRIDLRSMDPLAVRENNIPHLTTGVYIQNREGEKVAILNKEGTITERVNTTGNYPQQPFALSFYKFDQKEHGKYLLEITGDEVAKRNDLGYRETTIQIKEKNYYDTMQEALAALMQRDIRLFESFSEQAEEQRKSYAYASISDTDTRETLVDIIKISFSDSPEGSPRAGIYMNFNERATEDFEKLFNYNFSGFKEYDPGFPFLLLASFSYDRRLEVTRDPALKEWTEHLQSQEDAGLFNNEDWKYQVLFKTASISKAHQEEVTRQHFTDKAQAFHALLQIDPDQMDRDIAEKKGLKQYIREATLHQRGESPLIQIFGVREFQSPHLVSEPGIHLRFNIPISTFERETGFDLSGLGNYRQDEKYLLIANYNRQLNELIPLPEFLELRNSLPNKSPALKSERPERSHTLKVVWESTAKPTPDTQQVIDTPYSNMGTAFDALKHIDRRVLDKDLAAQAGFIMYVKKAAIYRDIDGVEIMSAFISRAGDEQLPHGVYIKMNQDQLTLEALKVIRPHIQEIEQASSVHFVIASVRSSVHEVNQEEIHRKQTAHERILQPASTGGRKL